MYVLSCLYKSFEANVENVIHQFNGLPVMSCYEQII